MRIFIILKCVCYFIKQDPETKTLLIPKSQLLKYEFELFNVQLLVESHLHNNSQSGYFIALSDEFTIIMICQEKASIRYGQEHKNKDYIHLWKPRHAFVYIHAARIYLCRSQYA